MKRVPGISDHAAIYISQMLNVWNICLHLGSNLCTFVGKYSSLIRRIWRKSSTNPLNTLPETNVFASENGWLEDDCFLFWYGLFSERLWVSGKCNPPKQRTSTSCPPKKVEPLCNIPPVKHILSNQEFPESMVMVMVIPRYEFQDLMRILFGWTSPWEAWCVWWNFWQEKHDKKKQCYHTIHGTNGIFTYTFSYIYHI